ALLFLVDRGELRADGFAARLGLLRGLRELEELHLERMALLARARELVAQPPRFFLRVAQLLLDRPQPRFDLGAGVGALRDAALQLLDLALPLQHAVQLRLGAVEHYALAAEEVPRLRDQHAAGRQQARERHAVLALGEDEDAGDRIAQVGHHARARAGDH